MKARLDRIIDRTGDERPREGGEPWSSGRISFEHPTDGLRELPLNDELAVTLDGQPAGLSELKQGDDMDLYGKPVSVVNAVRSDAPRSGRVDSQGYVTRMEHSVVDAREPRPISPAHSEPPPEKLAQAKAQRGKGKAPRHTARDDDPLPEGHH